MNESFFCNNDYSKSWDLLIPVVEKIKNINTLYIDYISIYNIDNAYWMLTTKNNVQYKTYTNIRLQNSLLEQNFYSVVEFVKCFNIFVLKKWQ